MTRPPGATRSSSPAPAKLDVAVELDPFRIVVRQDGVEILASLAGAPALAVDVRAQAQMPLVGYGAFVTVPLLRFGATTARISAGAAGASRRTTRSAGCSISP